jgi:hypothetical protein
MGRRMTGVCFKKQAASEPLPKLLEVHLLWKLLSNFINFIIVIQLSINKIQYIFIKTTFI